MFDWNFRFQWLPLRPQDEVIEGQPHEQPCLSGSSYAIRRDFFFHIGGYDEGLIIWNGENYELSIKLWLCAGGILEIPCSRAMHLSKRRTAHRHAEKAIDFVGMNLKRVAEVWLDDYKQYFYRGETKRYENLDPGDLTHQFEIKKNLNCKPFKHYLEVVATDMLERYPIHPQQFAAGLLQSNANSKCLHKPDNDAPVGLVDCYDSDGIDFILTFERSIRVNDTGDQCLSASKLKLSNCNHQGYDQHWKFDIQTRQLINPPSRKCLTVVNETKIEMAECDQNMSEQRWSWSYENTTALKNWDKVGFEVA